MVIWALWTASSLQHWTDWCSQCA